MTTSRFVWVGVLALLVSASSATAATRWSARWLLWVQDALLTGLSLT